MSDASDVAPTGGQTVTAVFDSREAAEHARRDLLEAGFPDAAIRFVHGPEAANAATPAKDPGILQSLLNIFVFMPPHDRSSYGEALRRGGTALAVHTDRDGYERAIDILDRDGAVDLDERETEWRSDTSDAAPTGQGVGATPLNDGSAYAAEHRHDPMVNPDANFDVRERIGVGTSDQTVASDLGPGSAATEPVRTAIPGEDAQSVTSRRDTTHGRRRVRGYISSAAGIPAGIDPQI